MFENIFEILIVVFLAGLATYDTLQSRRNNSDKYSPGIGYDLD